MAVNIKKIKDQTTLNQDYGLVLIKSSLWSYWSLRLDKGYGAAISETLTWEGPEVPLTDFFLTVYL